MSGPTITLEAIEANIVSEHFFTAADGVYAASKGFDDTPEKHPLSLLTICVLVLKNGFTVLGQSACAAPENFDAEIGRKIARMDAVDKVWPLMGYELKTQLAQEAEE